MNRIGNNALVVGFVTILALSATTAFAQNYYGLDACGPAACDAPVCDAPAYDVPGCDVPTCEPAACEPVGCGGYYGGISRGVVCGDLADLIGGALDAATSPIRWVAAAFTDGIYEGCGCAPAPPKTSCNPCDICGNYLGGCNECCKTPYYGAGAGTVDVFGDPVVAAQNVSTPNDSYPLDLYDAERYDSSPSRLPSIPDANGASGPEEIPAEAIRRAAYIPQRRPTFDARAFDDRTLVANRPNREVRPNAVRQVRFEENRSARNPIANAQVVFPVAPRQARFVDAAPLSPATRPAFGQVRPNQTTGARSLP